MLVAKYRNQTYYSNSSDLIYLFCHINLSKKKKEYAFRNNNQLSGRKSLAFFFGGVVVWGVGGPDK